MIAADTSAIIAYLGAGNLREPDIARLEEALQERELVLPAVVLTEALSNRQTASFAWPILRDVPLLDIVEGYWERAGASRAKLLQKGLKAALADTLIAQACIDADAPLITRDKDFRHFAQHCGLKLA